MHTAGKVLLIIGGIITALGIVMIVGGAASAGLILRRKCWEGTSGDFTIPDDDIYGVYIKGSASDCDAIGS